MDNQNNQIPQQPVSDTPAAQSAGDPAQIVAQSDTSANQALAADPVVAPVEMSMPAAPEPPSPTPIESMSPMTELQAPVSPVQEPSVQPTPPMNPVSESASAEPLVAQSQPDLVNQSYLATPAVSDPVVSPAPADQVVSSAETPSEFVADPVTPSETPASVTPELPSMPATPVATPPMATMESSAPIQTPPMDVSSPASVAPETMITTAPVSETRAPQDASAPVASGDNKGKKKGLSGRTALLGFIIGLVILSIPVSVILVQQQQNLMQEAKTKKNVVPARKRPEVIVVTPSPTVVPLTLENADSQLETMLKDIDNSVTSVNQDLNGLNKIDSQQDSVSI